MKKSTNRDRDTGRTYKSGSDKRKDKEKQHALIKSLPKLNKYFSSTSADASRGQETAVDKISDEPGTSSVSSRDASFYPISTVSQPTTGEQYYAHTVNEADLISSVEVYTDYVTDLGLWSPKCINEAFKDHWLEKGSAQCRHNDSNFKNSSVMIRGIARKCTPSIFIRKQALSGEEHDIKWLCYSESEGKVYCFICKLMSPHESKFTTGFNDWKHAESIVSHGKSAQHRNALSDAVIRSNVNLRVDKELVNEMLGEIKYWREVLTRVIDVLVFLCERGLAIRGHTEEIGSNHNGNFLGIIELLAKYDVFLAKHIERYGNKGKGSTSYLSHSVCDEFINIIAEKVMENIVEELKNAKYFSISIDSTPDITHTDQLSITIRYVLPSGPVERFLTFQPIFSHTGESLADVTLQFLSLKSIDIKHCRGQSYDNASNMSGRYKGVQSHIKRVCAYAEYCPCFAHSLNLVGSCAVESNLEAASLFSMIQQLYTFYSASTKLWKKQENMIAALDKSIPVVKRLSDTRWSARHDSVHALVLGYKDHIKLLEEISACDDFRAVVQAEATGLATKFSQLESSILLALWNTILQRVNSTSVQLQKEGLPLNTAVLLLDSLLGFISTFRERFDEFEIIGQEMCEKTSYRTEMDTQRERKRKRFYDEISETDHAEVTVVRPRDRFRINTYLPIIDRLHAALYSRKNAYKMLGDRFGFLPNIAGMREDNLREAAKKLVNVYPEDLDSELESELLHFSHLLKGLVDAGIMDTSKTLEIDMYKQICENDLTEAFPNVSIMLRIYLCMFVSNCKGERSFSKLKLVLNYLRNTMGQERLSSLALLSIEHVLLKSIDFGEIIDRFSKEKARRKDF